MELDVKYGAAEQRGADRGDRGADACLALGEAVFSSRVVRVDDDRGVVPAGRPFVDGEGNGHDLCDIDV
ncbi:hypothetical protein E4U60_003024 [Claviceps pazoutovae]|uniref:Uncharacterized protein n=1 Tax=Claviceps pazoutovae TaxID=1649127 RepID=A0A9P7MAK3_9HYPO|nr:hypothetical protein E4U60_003024 [Claviceps pazoutovae]